MANDSSEKDRILIQSVTTLFNTIANKCPFLTERNNDDLLVLTMENQRKIANTILSSDLSMSYESVKNCLVHASVAHEHPNGLNSKKNINIKEPKYFANEQLLFAAKNGNNHDLKTLIDKKVDVHYRNNRALIKAAEPGNTEGVKLLVENGADFKLNHFEALRLSTQNNHMETSIYLTSLDKVNSLEILKKLTYTSDDVIEKLMNSLPSSESSIKNQY